MAFKIMIMVFIILSSVSVGLYGYACGTFFFTVKNEEPCDYMGASLGFDRCAATALLLATVGASLYFKLPWSLGLIMAVVGLLLNYLVKIVLDSIANYWREGL